MCRMQQRIFYLANTATTCRRLCSQDIYFIAWLDIWDTACYFHTARKEAYSILYTFIDGDCWLIILYMARRAPGTLAFLSAAYRDITRSPAALATEVKVLYFTLEFSRAYRGLFDHFQGHEIVSALTLDASRVIYAAAPPQCSISNVTITHQHNVTSKLPRVNI